MSRFGVRPYPAGGEGLSGYLLRLAELNGLVSLDEVVAICSSKVSNRGKPERWSLSHVGEIMDGLSQRLGRDCEAEAQQFEHQHTVQGIEDPIRMVRDLRVSTPRFCIDCLLENEFLDWRWSLGHLAHCPVHRAPLIDTCPSCQSRLPWASELLRKCPNCKTLWDSQKNPHQQISDFEMNLWTQLTEESLGAPDALREVSAAIMLVARPFDSMIAPLNRFPATSNLWRVASTAYQLLQDPCSGSEIIRKRAERNEPLGFELSLSQRLAQVPPMKGSASLATNPSGDMPEILLEEDKSEFVTNKRNQVNRDRAIRDLEYQIDARGLAQVIGIPMTELRYCLKSHCITPLNNTHVVRQQIFDIRDLHCLSELVGQNNDSGASTLVSMNDVRLDRNLTSYGRLLAAVWSREVKGRLFWSNNVPTIEIDENTFDKWLGAELRAQCSGNLECYRVMAALHCGKGRLMSLVSAGRLECVDWVIGGRDKITGASYLEYLDSLDGGSRAAQ